MNCPKCNYKTPVRTLKANSALHLYFTLIAQELNELGQEFCYTGITGKELSLHYTPTIIKELFWKEIQFTMFGTKTTTKLTTEQMNMIIEVFSKFFAERGVVLGFPSIDSIELEK